MTSPSLPLPCAQSSPSRRLPSYAGSYGGADVTAPASYVPVAAALCITTNLGSECPLYKRTCAAQKSMSGLQPIATAKADIGLYALRQSRPRYLTTASTVGFLRQIEENNGGTPSYRD